MRNPENSAKKNGDVHRSKFEKIKSQFSEADLQNEYDFAYYKSLAKNASINKSPQSDFTSKKIIGSEKSEVERNLFKMLDSKKAKSVKNKLIIGQ